jgi:hypothetical protein
MYRIFQNILLVFSVNLIFQLHVFSTCIDGRNRPEADTSYYWKSIDRHRIYNTTRLTTTKPVIDGKLDDDCWYTGEWAGNFTQFIPNEGAKPSQLTELKILYDDKNIYVAVRAYDNEPEKIQRLAGLRDVFTGDMVGVTFDSYHDHRTGFEFDLTAYGQKVDLVLTNPMIVDPSWNPVWQGKVGMEDSAWVAEMEIPLSQLRYSGEDEQVWGMNCWRWIGRLQEESDFEAFTLTGPGVLYIFGELHGIQGLKKSQRLELMPYFLGKLNTYAKEPDNPYADQGRTWGGNIGLDAKVGLTNNFTIDMTINPDFGQVESDPSVMNLTAFETFYEEKRPFFLEGKTIFNYNLDDLNLFYTRRIGHVPSYIITPASDQFIETPDKTAILSAIKLSGKTANGLSVGMLQSLTAAEYARISDSESHEIKTMVEPLTNYLVTRVQKDYREGTTMLGGMLTATNRFIHSKALEFLCREAYTGGIDLLHQWKDKEFFVDAKLVGSYIKGEPQALKVIQESSARYYQRPGADYLDYDTSRTTLSGFGGKIKIGKGAKGLWRYNTSISWLSPGLEINDLGYLQSTDLIRNENNLSYFVNQPVSVFRTYTVNLEQFNSWNFSGSHLGSGAHLSFRSEFKNQWSFETNLIFHSQSLDTRILRGGNDMTTPHSFISFGGFHTDHAKKIAFGIEYEFEQVGNHSAVSYRLEPGIHLRPLNTLQISLAANYAENKDQLQYVTTKSLTAGYRYILGTIDQETLGLTFRVDYHITPEFSIQYYGSPFVSKGSYSEFKYVVDPLNKEYDKRFSIYRDPVLAEGLYNLDENNDQIADYTIDNPDFNFHQFRSNLVAKWEYRPGSFVYLVWSSERTGNADLANESMGSSFGQLWDAFPNNIFLIKFNYWFSL